MQSSHIPGRSVPTGWDTELYSTSRLASGHFWLGNAWVQGGVAYGWASQSDSASTKDQTNQLLMQMTQQVVANQYGLAFVAGDFNQHYESLQEPKKWEAWGWKELQQLAFERWQVEPSVTCKHKSRKDFIFLSPPLQKFVQSVSNTWDQFPDHSLLSAILAFPTENLTLAKWFRPQPIVYTDPAEMKVIQQSTCTVPTCEDASDQYEAIFAEFEQVVHEVKKARGQPGLLQAQKGRGRTRNRHFTSQVIAPVKPSRHGEEQPTFAGLNLRHKRWFTQLRRLVSYVNHVRHDRPEAAAIEHKFRLWRAIRLAPGFAPSFAQWWPTRATQTPDSVYGIPRCAPPFEIATRILEQFRREFALCEQVLNTHRQARQAARYQHDANQIFRDVRKPSAQPVQVLVAQQTAEISKVESPETVTMSSPAEVIPGQVWKSNQGQHVVHKTEDDVVSFQQPHGLVEGDVLQRETLLGSADEIHKAFAEEWVKRWDKHLHLPAGHWDEVTAFAEMALPHVPMTRKPITLDAWKTCIRAKKAHAATGMDGITRADLLSLPDQLHEAIIALLHQAETTGTWPIQALQGAIHSLAKRTDASLHALLHPPCTATCRDAVHQQSGTSSKLP
eukprot:s1448_g3.t1